MQGDDSIRGAHDGLDFSRVLCRSFRDLFSLLADLPAGHRHESRTSELMPCAWAASLMALDEQSGRNASPSSRTSSAIFELVAAQYHHALVHLWDRDAGPSLLRDIKELGLQDNNTAMGQIGRAHV